jgi:hypothetical protein
VKEWKIHFLNGPSAIDAVKMELFRFKVRVRGLKGREVHFLDGPSAIDAVETELHIYREIIIIIIIIIID